MPRFEKGSQEAKDFMAKIRNARKQPDYVPPANKRLTKKQKEKEALSKVSIDIPIMGKTSLIVPEYFAVPVKRGYKLVNPMSQERNLSSRGGKKSLKVVRKPVGDMALVREDGSEEPLPLLSFSKKDQKLLMGLSKMVEANKDKDPIDVRPLGRPKPLERGRPEKLPKNIAVHKQRKTRPGFSKKKSQKKQNEEDDDAELETKTTRKKPAAAAAAATEPENIQMAIEEAPAGYQRKQRETYATEEERKEAIKTQKREYARRKRAKIKAEGSGISGGALAAAELKDLLGASYDPKIDKVGDFELDKQVSSGTSKVYYNQNTGQAVVAHRGTAGISDWGNNAVYALGGKTAYKLTPRYKEAKKVQDKAEKKYGKQKVSTIGHSQGGLQAELLGGKSKEIITLNKATRPFESNTNKNQYDIRSKGDLVSGANPFGKKSKKDIAIKRQSSNPLTEHSSDVLDRLDKDQMIGQGLDSIQDKIDAKKSERDMLMSLYHKASEELDELYEEAMTSDSDMEGEGLRDWIRKRLGIRSPVVNPIEETAADIIRRRINAERDMMLEAQKYPLRQGQTSFGIPGHFVPPPPQQYNDMIFDDSGELVEGGGLLDYLMGTKKTESAEKKPLIPRPLPLRDTSQVRSQVEKNHYAIRNQINDAFEEGKINETERRVLVNILDPPLGFFDDSVRPTMELYKNQNAAMEALAERLSKKGSGLKSFKSGSYGSDYVVQSVIFNKDKYSVADAKKWLKVNNYKSPKVDETDNMLRFRQLSPSAVDAKGYTEYHNKPLGASGIQLVIAYRRKSEERMGQSFKKRLNARMKSMTGGSGRPKPDMSGFPDDNEEEPNNDEVPYLPDDLIAEVISFLPDALQRAYGISNRTIQRNTFSRAGLQTELQRLETMLRREAGDPKRKARLIILINKIRERLQLPPLSPITKPIKRPPPRDDDDEGNGGAPGIRRNLDMPVLGIGIKSGRKLVKGSQEAKDYMASIRARRKS